MRPLFAVREDFRQQPIGRVKHVVREMNAQLVADLD